MRLSAITRSAKLRKCRYKSYYCILAALNITNTGNILDERKRAWACKLLFLFFQKDRVPVKYKP
jgi:hypothetical protein